MAVDVILLFQNTDHMIVVGLITCCICALFALKKYYYIPRPCPHHAKEISKFYCYVQAY